MRVWWVLAWDNYYPDGGLDNMSSTWATEEEAEAAAEELRQGGGRTFPPDHVEVVNIAEYL